MKYLRWLVLLVPLAGVAMSSFNLFFRERAAESRADREMAVRVARVQRVSIPVKIRLSGELQPIDEAEIVSRLAGKVTDVRFKVGDIVPSGAIVATIRANGLDQRIARSKDNITSAQQKLRSREDQLAQAETRLAQDREFFQRDWIARRDVERAELAMEMARAQAELAQAHLAQQEAMLAQLRAVQNLTRLSAPTGGEVSRQFVKPGTLVGEGTAIIAIADLNALKLRAGVRSLVVPGLRPGLDVQITTPSLPSVVAKGKIMRLEPPKTGEAAMVAVEIQVSNPQRKLLPGMLVEASLDLNRDEKILLVPRAAVASENKVDFVYKIAAGRAIRQQVVLGWERGEDVIVVQGLSEGESIAADITKISRAAPVRVLNVRMTPGPDARQ